MIAQAAHTLILDGRERYEAEYAVGRPLAAKTGKPFRSNTKAFTDWAEKLGKPGIADTDAAMIEEMAASVRSHVFARELLADGVPEGLVRCRRHGFLCQARLEWVNLVDRRGLVDLKTADSIDSLESHIDAFKYVHQLAFYRSLFEQASGVMLPVHIIAVEKREPFRCGVWRISAHYLDAAQPANDDAGGIHSGHLNREKFGYVENVVLAQGIRPNYGPSAWDDSIPF